MSWEWVPGTVLRLPSTPHTALLWDRNTAVRVGQGAPAGTASCPLASAWRAHVARSPCLLGPLQARAVPHTSFGFSALILCQIYMFLIFKETTKPFSRVPFYLLSASVRCFSSSPSQHLLLILSHLERVWVVLHVVSLCLSLMTMTVVSLYVLTDQLCIWFGDMSTHVFHPFKNPHL